MSDRRIILVTGLSGAGKTTAMGVLEDLGYTCIDGYPVELLEQLVGLLENTTNDKYQHVALSVTSLDYEQVHSAMARLEVDLQILFLESDRDNLLLRYKYSRRSHPLLVAQQVNSLEEAIEYEIRDSKTIKERATVKIDTSHLSQQDLRKKIQAVFSLSIKPSFSISFISFGFRYGVPLDADLIFDVRFLINPFWVESLQAKTGNDAEVFAYVMEDEKTKAYLNRLLPFLEYSLHEYQLEGKSHFTVGIGCTGGQHRSVALVNWLYEHFKEEYTCFREHRDLKEENL